MTDQSTTAKSSLTESIWKAQTKVNEQAFNVRRLALIMSGKGYAQLQLETAQLFPPALQRMDGLWGMSIWIDQHATDEFRIVTQP